MPEMRPTEKSASLLNAEGEKSRSVIAHAPHRSVTATVTDFPWSEFGSQPQGVRSGGMNVQVAVIDLPQMGLLLGFTPE
jgi:hypothetical protein